METTRSSFGCRHSSTMTDIKRDVFFAGKQSILRSEAEEAAMSHRGQKPSETDM